MLITWLQFLLCLALITGAGQRLSLYGGIIAEEMGLSLTWVGLVLIASVTSLPELATGLSSVAAADSPDIAVGDVLGSCVFNLMLIVILDFLLRKESVYTRAHIGHALSAGFGVVLIGFVGSSILLSQAGMMWSLGHVGLYTPLILVFYALAIRTLFRYEQAQPLPLTKREVRKHGISLEQAKLGYVMASLIVIVAGIWLPFVGKEIAGMMGWEESFVGTLFVALVTSLPEAVVTIFALRLGAVDLALGNILGSNLFNIAILALDDLAYLPGPLLAAVSPAHIISVLSAMMMSGIAIVGLFYRPQKRVLKSVGWLSLFLLSIYLINSFVIYLHG